ncbi:MULTISPECIES: Clp protease N-terminal domain-containing protein [unclassified Streptomyces]|uniref:Clp protease N-terminal domain-containing protein n=1 Tax=unclassified Streptomyces TaxID=2593676 RepID=UPI0035DC20EE
MTEAGEAGELDDVQSRVPRQPPSGQDALRPDDDARLSAELAAAVAGARRRAVRDGDRQIDTAHLLHTLLESDPEVRAVFDGGPQIARLLGYLVQRSIGYGLRWQSTVEDSGALPVVTEADGLSPMAFAALEYACERAARRGDDLARGLDLLAAIVVDPQARAVEVLTRAAIDAGELAARLDNDARDCPGKYAADGGPTY